MSRSHRGRSSGCGRRPRIAVPKVASMFSPSTSTQVMRPSFAMSRLRRAPQWSAGPDPMGRRRRPDSQWPTRESAPRTRRGALSEPAGGLRGLLATGDEPVDQQHDERADDREHPGPDREEVAEGGVEQDAAEPAAQECADDAEEEGDEPSPALPTGHEELGDRSRDQTKDQKCNES